jgi:hypothetical protein
VALVRHKEANSLATSVQSDIRLFNSPPQVRLLYPYSL